MKRKKFTHHPSLYKRSQKIFFRRGARVTTQCKSTWVRMRIETSARGFVSSNGVSSALFDNIGPIQIQTQFQTQFRQIQSSS
jgi:hypothetical protein